MAIKTSSQYFWLQSETETKRKKTEEKRKTKELASHEEGAYPLRRSINYKLSIC